MAEKDKETGPDYKTFTDADLVKIIAYGFVFSVFLLIFFKILFLE